MNIKEVQYQNADNWGFFVDIEKEKIQPFNTDNTNNNKINNNVNAKVNDNNTNVNANDNNVNANDNIVNEDNDDDNIIPKLIVIAQIITTVFFISCICYILLIVV
jgi:vacuolar protein sorting-associated protein 13A/C